MTAPATSTLIWLYTSRNLKIIIPTALFIFGFFFALSLHFNDTQSFERLVNWSQQARLYPPPSQDTLERYQPDTPLAKAVSLYGNLPATLEHQEKLYQDYILRRNKHFHKWGATIDNIPTFPEPGGDFYVLWDFFIPAFTCPHPVERVGILGDGGKWVCGTDRVIQQEDCVIFSFGVEQSSSFEAEVLHRSKTCTIHGFDFSVNKWGPDVDNIPSYKPRVHFNKYRIGDEDNLNANPPIYSLRTIWDQSGYDFVDIFKIDIEEAEFGALKSFIESYKGEPLPFGQMQVEIHVWNKTMREFLQFWGMLEDAGLRPFWTEVNLPAANQSRPPNVAEWSFINIRGDHILLNNNPKRRTAKTNVEPQSTEPSTLEISSSRI